MAAWTECGSGFDMKVSSIKRTSDIFVPQGNVWCPLNWTQPKVGVLGCPEFPELVDGQGHAGAEGCGTAGTWQLCHGGAHLGGTGTSGSHGDLGRPARPCLRATKCQCGRSSPSTEGSFHFPSHSSAVNLLAVTSRSGCLILIVVWHFQSFSGSWRGHEGYDIYNKSFHFNHTSHNRISC